MKPPHRTPPEPRGRQRRNGLEALPSGRPADERRWDSRDPTIYPGWYRGRAVHIHAKVLLSGQEVLTTQLYFDDELNQSFFATPHSDHAGRDTFNSDDNAFSDKTILTTSNDGAGYLGLITIGIKQ